MNTTRKERFEEIYSSHFWRGKSKSGPGSDEINIKRYIRFVNNWLKDHAQINQIIEIGCGDWATSRYLNIGKNRIYIGIDVVPDLIERDREYYSSETIKFLCSDFIEELPPKGDLLLVKDVLQHLSNKSVLFFIQNILPRYEYAIITNDSIKIERRKTALFLNNDINISVANVDINDGESRPLKLTEFPFNLNICATYSFETLIRKNNPKLIYTKEILVWGNNNRP